MRRPPRRPALSERDRGVLEIERRWGPGPSALEHKLTHARDHLGLDAGGYALVLNGLIDDPAAFTHDPRTITRLREMRDLRREGRGSADG